LLQLLKLRLRRVWLHWDRYPKDGTRDHAFCDIIEIRGWALALDGIRSIEIRCDGELLGTAAIGLRRRDVFEMFPYIRGSRRSGFQYVLDTTRIANDVHELTIVGRSARGRTARLSAPIFIKNLSNRDDRYRRQTAPNAAALGWMRRNQQHLPYRPKIELAVRIAQPAELESLGATIRSLTAQVYDDWRLHVIVDSISASTAHQPAAQARVAPLLALRAGGSEPGLSRLEQLVNLDARVTLDDPCASADSRRVLNPGDVLSPNALFEMVYSLNRTPVRVTQHATPSLEPVVVDHAPFPFIDLEGVRSILVVKLDHLGDVLLTIPAMRRLRELCPEARITALVGSWARPLVEAESCIDEVLMYDFFCASSARNCRRLADADYKQIADVFAGRRFDLAVDLRRESDTREFLKLSWATHTAGYANRGEHDWLTIAIPWDDVNTVQPPRRHVAMDALRLVEMIAMSARAETIEDFRLSVAQDREAEQLLSEELPTEPGLLVGLHPGAGRAIKCWPAERFAQIADRLIGELGATVVLFGTDADALQTAKFQRHVRGRDRLISLVNQLRLPQFMGLLKRLDFFIGNDSGPTHMAAASGIPTLGVYAATVDASQWAPLGPQAAVIQKKMQCSPCYLAKKPDCPYGVACLEEISVEEVWEAAIRVLLPKWDKVPSLTAGRARLQPSR
jgi:ADP-heptose:LPS heptosyltransferase